MTLGDVGKRRGARSAGSCKPRSSRAAAGCQARRGAAPRRGPGRRQAGRGGEGSAPATVRGPLRRGFMLDFLQFSTPRNFRFTGSSTPYQSHLWDCARQRRQAHGD